LATRTAVQKRAKSRRPRWVRILKRTLAVFSLLFLIGAVVVGWIFAGKLKMAEERMSRLPDILREVGSKPTIIYTADGKPMFKIAAKNRMYVKISDVPQVVINATLAAEDKRFYSHSGIDYWALGRIVWANAREGSSQGGSTITMQIVKRVFTSPAKTLDRKLDDMALAVVIERRLSKDQILQLYLNEVFYGEGAWGIKAAADVYFGKTLDKLTIAEAATLARCVRRPSDENPFRNPTKALENRDVVLSIMRDEGMITEQEYQDAKAERMVLAARKSIDTAVYYRAPYAVRHVLDVIKKDLPDIDLTQGGYRIDTTIDSRLQSVGEKTVREVVERNKGNRVTTGAFVMADRDGRILVEVGGTDFQKNQFNVITQGKRQPGSSFKPFVYSAALATGAISPRSTISNAPYVFKDPYSGKVWAPKNSNGRYSGAVPIKTAIAYSYNMPAIRVMEAAGPMNVSTMDRDIFGFTSEIKPLLSSALGASEVRPIEMLQGYSVFQLGGDRATPFIITRVLDSRDQIVKEYTPNIQRNVLSRDIAAVMDDCLRAVATYGTGHKATSSGIREARGKTGTTSDNKDAWFCGYTPEFVGIGWIANEQHPPGGGVLYDKMGRSVFGGAVTIDIWIGVMKKAQELVAEGVYTKYDPEQGASYFEADQTKNQEPAPSLDGNTVEPADHEPLTPAAPDDTAPDAPVEAPPTNQVPQPREQPRGEPPTPVTTNPIPRENPRPETRGPSYVSVEICADTGLIANMYCPETVIRQYVKGQQPTRVCRRHRP
jgi:penicillin-binding protein 1A